LKQVAFVIALTLFSSVVWPGYAFFESDQGYYFSDLRLSPEQKAEQPVFLKPADRSIMMVGLGSMAKLLNDKIFFYFVFVFFVLVKFVLLASVFLLAFHFGQSEVAAALIAIVLSFNYQYAPVYLMPIGVAFALSLLELYLMQTKEYFAVGFFIAVAILVHATTGIFFFIVTLVWLLYNKRFPEVPPLFFFVGSTLLFSMFVFGSPFPIEQYTPEWEAVAIEHQPFFELSTGFGLLNWNIIMGLELHRLLFLVLMLLVAFAIWWLVSLFSWENIKDFLPIISVILFLFVSLAIWNNGFGFVYPEYKNNPVYMDLCERQPIGDYEVKVYPFACRKNSGDYSYYKGITVFDKRAYEYFEGIK